MMQRFAKTFAVLCAAGLLGMGVAGCNDNNSGLHKDSTMSNMDSMGTKKDIIDTATGPGMQRVTTLVTAIKAAGLVDTLKGPGPFTVFAPTNEAFAKLPAGTVENLLKPENKEKLKSILLYHVHIGDAVMAKDVKTMNLSTANGKPLMVNVDNGNVMVNNAKVIKTDVVCSNGIIHWVDTVILP
jgi:uncharacterized surface protein with fasciclin (FAS1) repeats